MRNIFIASTLFYLISFAFNVNAQFEIKAKSAILQDFHSGEILFEKNADTKIFPASMTKIMTSIITFEY